MKKWNLEIESKANEILKMNNYSGGKVNVDKIAESNGIKVSRYDFNNNELNQFDQVSGTLIIKKDGTKIIGINKNEDSKRQRFTLAHELGHYFLGHLKEAEVILDTKRLYRNINSSLGNKKEEVEANAFAAALLMPKAEVVRLLKEEQRRVDIFDDSEIIKNIAETLNVSEISMSFRLNRLGLINTDNYAF